MEKRNTTEIIPRLFQNKGSAIGMSIIIFSLFIAVFGYLLAPDGSPNANRMIIEIGGQKPGFRQAFLAWPVSERPERSSIVHRILYGQPDTADYIPINSYHVFNDSIGFEQRIDEDTLVHLTKALPIDPTSGKTYVPAVINRVFYLGTDKYGRDILSRLMIGVRVSLSVGLVTVLLSLLLGIGLGALAGYYRGRTDLVVMWFINVIWSIPTVLLVFAITFLLGKGYWQVMVAIGLTMWVNVARIVRGQVLTVRELDYITAARSLGFSTTRILFRHILPNITGPVTVVAAANFASSIVIEAGLSFLGIGVQPPQPSWGLMIKENFNFIITHNPMLALAPGFAIMLLVLAFNLLGNGLRDALSVKD
jgi:peptide/nickel transport system permease protein